MIGFVFPSDPFNTKLVDEGYQHEFEKFKAAGYPVYLIDIDNLEHTKVFPKLENDTLIYRGWMLTDEKYQLLNKNLNNQLKTSPVSYLNSHHLPNWYESIKDLTIPSFITNEENAGSLFKQLQTEPGYEKVFVKDYVKSLKTGKGSIVDSLGDMTRALDDMKKYRGFIEGGIIMRQVIEIKPETEKRYFVLNGKVFGADGDMMEVAQKISQKHHEFFYSVDLIKDQNNKIHVIEIGDGQVSDTVGWNIYEFVQIFDTLRLKNKPKI